MQRDTTTERLQDHSPTRRKMSHHLKNKDRPPRAAQTHGAPGSTQEPQHPCQLHLRSRSMNMNMTINVEDKDMRQNNNNSPKPRPNDPQYTTCQELRAGSTNPRSQTYQTMIRTTTWTTTHQTGHLRAHQQRHRWVHHQCLTTHYVKHVNWNVSDPRKQKHRARGTTNRRGKHHQRVSHSHLGPLPQAGQPPHLLVTTDLKLPRQLSPKKGFTNHSHHRGHRRSHGTS